MVTFGQPPWASTRESMEVPLGRSPRSSRGPSKCMGHRRHLPVGFYATDRPFLEARTPLYLRLSRQILDLAMAARHSTCLTCGVVLRLDMVKVADCPIGNLPMLQAARKPTHSI